MSHRPTSSAAPPLCPRCGAGFRCGIGDLNPCACTTVALDAATLEQLRRSFDGCLCLDCLQQASRGRPVVSETAP